MGETHAAELSLEDREVLASLGTVRRFAAGAVIIQDGRSDDHVIVIRRGCVKIVRSASAEGGELILGIRGAGDVIGELASIGGRPRHGSVVALEQVEALIVPGPRFARLIADDARISLAIARVLSARLAEADRYRQVCGDLGVAQALAHLILDLTARYGGRVSGTAWVLGVPLTQQDMADYLGVSYRTIARTLAAWRHAGLISTERRRILIHDLVTFRSQAVLETQRALRPRKVRSEPSSGRPDHPSQERGQVTPAAP
jgi:CRP-like cAMP-binding protein